MIEKPVLLLFLLLCTFNLLSQDLHYSNYDFNLSYLNPAEAGAFLGTVRLQASHRDQYDAFIEEGYNSQLVQVDLPLRFKFLKRGWTGYGLAFFNDRSGDLGFNNTGVLASLSYHYPLDKKMRQVISGGFSVGQIQRSMNNSSAAKFSDALLGGGVSSDFGLLDQFNENYTDYSIGLSFKSIVSKRIRYQIGASSFHSFDFSQNTTNNNKIWRRYNVYGTVDYRLNKDIIIQPRVFASFISTFHAINLQTIAKYNFQQKMVIGAGLGYRVADALQILLVGEYRDWEFGLAYDVTVSSAGAYNNRQGAFELGVKKIFILKKRPKITPIDICPRL